MRRSPRLALGLLVVSAAFMPARLLADLVDIVPTNLGLLHLAPGAFFEALTINASAGDQFDPHIDGDLVSYTSNSTVRYYDFFTGNDFDIIAPSGAIDFLSDVSGALIAYTRVNSDGDMPVMVLQSEKGAAIEIDSRDAPVQSNPAIGGTTVAFIDLELTAGGDLKARRLVGAPGTAARLTDDTRIDLQPAVAPSGDVIVFESCATSPSNCDIHQATWNGLSWDVAELTNNATPEANPDTDDVVVVYDATRSGERDIYWQPVGGGNEHRLVLTGEQRNPSVRGGLIAFESIPPGDTAAELMVYHVATNRMFAITFTPSDESLNDVTALGDGQFRVVWSSGPSGDRDVYGVTFGLPPVYTFRFGGLLPPVDPYATFNSMKAGAAVAVKFSLGGFNGLEIFVAGYPQSQNINCTSSAPQDDIEQTVGAGGSSLQYDAGTDQYSYIWKTERGWAGTCRQLKLQFIDGTVAYANFKFK